VASFRLAILALILCFCSGLYAQEEATVKSLLDQDSQQSDSAQQDSDSLQKQVTNGATNSLARDENLEIESLPFDEYHRMTPRASMQGYLKAVKALDYELATKYLDYRNLPSEIQGIAPELLAEQLMLVLDRTIWIDLNSLSMHAEGKKNESVPAYRDLIAEIETSKGSVQILMQHVPDEENKQLVWKISNATVSQIPFLIEEFGYNELGEWLYHHLPKIDFLNVMLWQWLYFLGMFIGFFLLSMLITRVVAGLLKTIRPSTQEDILSFIKGPICLLIAIIISRTFHGDSNITIAVAALEHAATILLIAWSWVLIRSIDLIKHRMAQSFVANDKPQAVFLLRPASNVVKMCIIIVMTLLWFENLGFKATTLLAGLGIGGLAIALAAQKTVENVIGAITLYASAPVKIGDLCQFAKNFGVIEEIGLRATRIRTIDRSVIYVPNAKFVDMELENVSEREKIAYKPKLMLSEKTTQANLAAFMDACKTLLEQHEMIDETPCRVRFKGFTPWALEVDVLSYVATTDFAQYMEIIEELNLALLGLLNEHNCKLASPEFAKLSE
jgi:MscS family membrane protein